jgi:hypothetical protein
LYYLATNEQTNKQTNKQRINPATMSYNNPMYTSGDMSAGTQQAVAQRGTPATLNLDDIFGDVMFTPDGDTVFLSEEQEALASGEKEISTMARKVQGDRYVPVQRGGGLYTTQLHEREKVATTMGSAGAAPTYAAVPFTKAPQERHHLQYAMSSKSKKNRGSSRGMTEQQKSERR